MILGEGEDKAAIKPSKPAPQQKAAEPAKAQKPQAKAQDAPAPKPKAPDAPVPQAANDPDIPEGTEMVMPGDNVSLAVKLIAPIAMDQGLRFAIREGGRTVGAGVVGSITK